MCKTDEGYNNEVADYSEENGSLGMLLHSFLSSWDLQSCLIHGKILCHIGNSPIVKM